MKKSLVVFFAVLTLCVFTGCKKDEKIIFWSFNNEAEKLINSYYIKDNPDFKFDYSVTPVDQFTDKLDPVLASGRGTPDVFALDASFVRKYVESGFLLDLTDIYEKNRNKLFAYPVEIGTYNGRVYAMSWQVCPGAMFYRRSLARKYIGTDNPAVVYNYFSDLNMFIRTAELIKTRSNDSCAVIPGYEDLFDVFLGMRNEPWIVNGSLVIDPVMDAYIDFCKIVFDNRYNAGITQLSEDWYAGMNDSLFDNNGNQIEVFSYFLPSWGINDFLKQYAPDTSGDWAMIPGPAPFYRGGTWLGAWKDTKNAEAVKDLIEYLTANDTFLEEFAYDSGDLVNNLNVLNKIAPAFSEPFLGGQNYYADFTEIAGKVNGRLAQGTDQIINDFFKAEVSAYINGGKTKTQALVDFRQAVSVQFGL